MQRGRSYLRPGTRNRLKATNMNGQWLGRYNGTNSGLLVVDLDKVGDHFEGRATAYNADKSLPSAVVFIKTPDTTAGPFRLCVDLEPVNPRTGDVASWSQISSLFPPNVVFPTRADIHLGVEADVLKVHWNTDIGTHGSAELPKTSADRPTELQPLSNVTTWEQFKDHVNRMEYRRYIFRGQRQTLRLRTGFHRTGRADLARFLATDIQTLHRHLSQRTSHIFNLNIPDENGAFFNLVQHHGYPTPLLDWTYSPYVAAFFAYQRVRNSEAERASENDKVRIFLFDRILWQQNFQQVAKVTGCPLHFSIMEFISIDNERLIPQQSVSSISTVDDIEGYIRSRETDERRFLQIIDLPLQERPRVMRELSIMGITAGSLFPGLDGACEELRERFFDL